MAQATELRHCSTGRLHWRSRTAGIALLTASWLPAGAALAEPTVQMIPCSEQCDPKPGEQAQLHAEYERFVRALIDEVKGRLPPHLRVRVMFNASGRIDYEHPKRLIMIGSAEIQRLKHEYLEEFGDLEGTAEWRYALESIVEWSFYHELGHALIMTQTGWPLEQRRKHEVWADDFATVALLDWCGEGEKRAMYAAASFLAMASQAYTLEFTNGVLRAKSKPIPGRFGSHAPRRDSRARDAARRQGRTGVADSGHEPGEERAFWIDCVTYGRTRDEVMRPEDQVINDYELICEGNEYRNYRADIVGLLKQAPARARGDRLVTPTRSAVPASLTDADDDYDETDGTIDERLAEEDDD